MNDSVLELDKKRSGGGTAFSIVLSKSPRCEK